MSCYGNSDFMSFFNQYRGSVHSYFHFCIFSRFQLFAGTLEVCPVRLGLTRSLALPVCAGVEAGVLRAEGKGGPRVANPDTGYVAWVAAVLAPRLRLDLGRVFAELVAEERFPLVRREFKLRQSEQVIHDLPHVAFGAVGASIVFRSSR
jgi:hypothetical protein